jgi:hypothetical protein
MKIKIGPHIERKRLLRLVDGELPTGEDASARDHLRGCSQCQVEFAELQEEVENYAEFHQTALNASMPAPPRAWKEISAILACAQEEPAALSWWRGGFFGPKSVWVGALAMLTLVAAVLVRLDRPAPVSAAELLRKAAAKEPRSGGAKRRIRIKSGRRTFERAARIANQQFGVREVDSELRAKFEAAHFSWDDLLNARSFAQWRDGLREKKDQVETLSADGTAISRIRTTTDQNALVEATISLRSVDLLPVAETMRFRGGEWVEISEVAGGLEAQQPAAAPAPRRSGTEVVEPTAAASAPGPGLELKVVAALHDAGADLGDPVQITRTATSILVASSALGEEKQSEIERSLRGIAGVELRFDTHAAIPTGPGAAPRSPAAASVSDSVSADLQHRLGDGAAVEEFTNRVLDTSDSILAHAFALRSLAVRFPPPVEAQFSDAERQVLSRIRRDHLQSAADGLERLKSTLQTGFPAWLATHRERPQPASASNWQEGAQSLLDSARNLDRLLNGTFGGRAGEQAAKITEGLDSLEAQLSYIRQLAETRR